MKWLPILGLIALLGVSCDGPVVPAIPFLIGVSQANLSEPWRISMNDEILRTAAMHPELRVIVADASDSRGKQIGDIEKFEGLGVDLMIISPLESEALTPTVTRIFQKMPVIVVNLSVTNDDYSLFIGPDNTRIGQDAGRFVARTLRGSGGSILEVLGRSGSPPTLERAQGFRNEIDKNPLIRLQSPILANWLRDGAEDLVLERLKSDPIPQVIFAHNDAMAYGAWLAANQLGLAKKIRFVGVDGLSGPQGGLELLRSGILDATFVSPTGGQEAVEYALAILHRQPNLPKKVILGTRFLTTRDLVSNSPKAPVAHNRKLVFRASTGQDAWGKQLKKSILESLKNDGWTVVEQRSGPLPPDADGLVVDATDQDITDRLARESLEEEARQRGIPLFRLGPQPAADDDGTWALALGPDPVEEGRRIGSWMVGERVRWIVELAGPSDSTGTSDCSRGLEEGLGDRGKVVARVNLDGARASARDTVLAELDRGLRFDGIVAHSDEAALGAADALRLRHLLPGPSVRIAAVGGGDEVRTALRNRDISCVVRSPSDLGPLLIPELNRTFRDGGVPRRLVTSHDVETP